MKCCCGSDIVHPEEELDEMNNFCYPSSCLISGGSFAKDSTVTCQLEISVVTAEGTYLEVVGV